MRRPCVGFLAVAVLLGAVQVGTVAVASERADLARQMLLDLADVAQDAALAQRVQAASPEVLEAIADQSPDLATLVADVRQLRTGAFAPRTAAPPLTAAAGPYPPDYPSGLGYDAFVASLFGLGLLADTNGDGKTNDERCAANGVAAANITLTGLTETSIALQAACDSITVILGEGSNLPACIAAGIANAATEANETVLRQCDYQDGNVDSAELEAAYENSRDIIARLESIEGKLDFVMRALIEQNLHNDSGSRIASFYLPEDAGGRLALVREVVANTIVGNENAGLHVVHAQKWLAIGDTLRRERDWKRAFEAYKRSYRQATSRSNDTLP